MFVLVRLSSMPFMAAMFCSVWSSLVACVVFVEASVVSSMNIMSDMFVPRGGAIGALFWLFVAWARSWVITAIRIRNR